MLQDRSGKKLRKILIAVVMAATVVVGGVLIWQLLPKHTTTSTTSQSNEKKAYVRTTKVPNDWKKYTDARYPFSIAYPAQWEPQVDTRANPLLYDYEVAFVSIDDTETAKAIVGVKKQKLQDAVAQFKSNFLEVGAVHPRLLAETQLTIDGHEAVEIRYQQDIGTADNHRLGDIEKQYFISYNDNVYTPQPVYENGQPGGLNAAQSLILFESLIIGKK